VVLDGVVVARTTSYSLVVRVVVIVAAVVVLSFGWLLAVELNEAMQEE
jgi:hypothetical protein